MPDTISVFYYSQHALVLAINIPVVAIAFSQKKTKTLATKISVGMKNVLRGWRMTHLFLCPTTNKARKITNHPQKKVMSFFVLKQKKKKEE